MSDDYEAADRLLALLEDVDAGRPLRLADIRQRFGVDDACARRYRKWIARHRELVEERDGREKVWRKLPDEDPSPTAIARAAALAFAVEALSELRDTDHHDALENLSHEARLSIPDGQRSKLDRVTRTFQARNPSSSLNPRRAEWLRRLMTSIQDRHPCRMAYERRDGDVREYTVEPWGMVLYDGRLMLVAGKREPGARPKRRLFGIDGIRKLVVLDGRFTEPPERAVNFHEAFEHSIGIFWDWHDPPAEVHLRVRGRHAVALRQRRVHPSQQQQVGEGGWLDVWLTVALSPEVNSFVLRMLPDVQVVRPEALRCAVEDAIQKFSRLDRSETDR